MDLNKHKYKHSEFTEKIIQAFFTVYNTLGYGFLEKVYENAMPIELRKIGLDCESQKHIKVFYLKEQVGNYFADILVEDIIIVELKTSPKLNEADANQLINYLKVTELEVGLLLNFGIKPEFRRRVFSN